MAAIVKPTLQFLIDWARAPDLRVSTDFQHALRDFSSTTRIGELAQGISYAYWTWQRGYSWIADFRPWAVGLVPIYDGEKSPDFVMLNPVTNDLAIMESKGTGAACHKAAMGKALRQCREAVEHSTFTRGFGSILTLDSDNSSGVGTLHIRDPESHSELTDELKYDLFRRSYASWFDLVGDELQANKCRQRSTTSTPQNLDAQVDKPRNDSINSLGEIVMVALGFDPAVTFFEIDPEIMEALSDIDAFKRIDWREFSNRMQMQPEQVRKLIRFPDGTSIVER
ncbi:hypothetical protein [Pseudomonas kilonensis]|uniref:hypothetical protein n=1 Tax=Pseudomonas kilonensis TaxID=132476 RepID=UPI001181FF87|nr:hypothetical protein [Pseudomonas kilonensis]